MTLLMNTIYLSLGSANNAAAAIDDDNVEDLTMSPEEAQQLLGQHLGMLMNAVLCLR